MPFLLVFLLAIPGISWGLSLDDLVNRGIPTECLAYDTNWDIGTIPDPVEPPPDPVEPPPDPVEPPPDPVDPPPPSDLGLDVNVQVAACDYDSASKLSVSRCPTSQAINGLGAYLQFDNMDLRGASCVKVRMANEPRRGIAVRVNGSTVARLPSDGLVTADITTQVCDNCTVQLYQDGSFGSDFVWLYSFEFVDCATE